MPRPWYTFTGRHQHTAWAKSTKSHQLDPNSKIFILPNLRQRTPGYGFKATKCECPNLSIRAPLRRCHLKLFPLYRNLSLAVPPTPQSSVSHKDRTYRPNMEATLFSNKLSRYNCNLTESVTSMLPSAAANGTKIRHRLRHSKHRLYTGGVREHGAFLHLKIKKDWLCAKKCDALWNPLKCGVGPLQVSLGLDGIKRNAHAFVFFLKFLVKYEAKLTLLCPTVPRVGIEPTTFRFSACCSTTELPKPATVRPK